MTTPQKSNKTARGSGLAPPRETKKKPPAPEQKPKFRAYDADEMAFLRQLDDLPDGMDLTPEQVTLVLSVDEEWLKKKRMGTEGAGPPFEKLGDGDGKAPIRYPLGPLRAWQKSHRHVNTMSAKHASRYPSFTSWMSSAKLDEEWLFVERNGRPVDALSEGESMDKPFTLTMDEYLDRVRKTARHAKLERDKGDVAGSMAAPQGDSKRWGKI